MAFFEGLVIGVLAGLLLRPFLDAYLIHQQILEAQRESRSGDPDPHRFESAAEDASPSSPEHGPT